jgi:hypothetical protein
VANLFSIKAENKKLNFFYEFEESINYDLLGDKVRIYQILVNLIGNSFKFIEKGFLNLSVKRANNNDNDKLNNNNIKMENNQSEFENLLFSIKASCVGISVQQIKSLFGRFDQADETIITKFGGTGPGLNIVRSLVQLQGGDINVKSELGKGSIFYFNLKLRKISKINNDKNKNVNFLTKTELKENTIDNRNAQMGFEEDNKNNHNKIFFKKEADLKAVDFNIYGIRNINLNIDYNEKIKNKFFEDICVNVKYLLKFLKKRIKL